MNTEEYLGQAAMLSAQVDAKLPELKRWNELLEKACAVSVPGEDPTLQSAVSKITELRTELNREIDALVDVRQEIADRLASLHDPLYRTLLELRYLQGLSWEAVSLELGYSRRHVYRLRDRALAALEENAEKKSRRLPS